MSFIERIKRVTKEGFNSQNDFARNLGVSGVTISTYTSGKQRPKYDILEKIYNLGYSIDWLISGKGSMKNSTAVGRDVRFQFIFEDNQMITSCLYDYEDAELVAFAERVKAGKDKNLKHVLEYKEGEFVKILIRREER